jgi:hypothetical protein
LSSSFSVNFAPKLILFTKRGELTEASIIPFSITISFTGVIISGSKLTKALSGDSIILLLLKLRIEKLAIIIPAKSKTNILFLRKNLYIFPLIAKTFP